MSEQARERGGEGERERGDGERGGERERERGERGREREREGGTRTRKLYFTRIIV